MVLGLVHTDRFRFSFVTEGFRTFTLSLLMAVFFVLPCGAEELTTQPETQVGDEIPGSTFYVPKSMFQTSQAYQAYCKSMYDLGYMNGQMEWTEAAKAFIYDPYDEEIAAALEEDRQRILKERAEDDGGIGFTETVPTYEYDTNRNTSEIADTITEAADPSLRMTEKETELQETVLTASDHSMSYGRILYDLFICLIVLGMGLFPLAMRFYRKK